MEVVGGSQKEGLDLAHLRMGQKGVSKVPLYGTKSSTFKSVTDAKV